MSRRSCKFRDRIVQGALKQNSGSGNPADRWSQVKPTEQVMQDITPSTTPKGGTKGAGERRQKTLARAKEQADRILKQLVKKF